MANPRVFVSSTCYDLRYIRENLKFFIKNMGFEPILSEDSGIFYDPEMHVEDSCLAEVSNCQMLVLIIGGRYGSKYKSEPESITNHEYKTAIQNKIPVFAMVEQQVNAEYRVYSKNKEKEEIASKIDYPGVDTTKIFDFMEEVQSKSVNNALVAFSDFNQLESHLKKQWAGMMFNFLTKKAEKERVVDMLDTLQTMSNRIEFLTKEILSSVSKGEEKLNAELYDIIVAFTSGSTFLRKLFERISPIEVLNEEKLEELAKKYCDDWSLTGNGRYYRYRINDQAALLGKDNFDRYSKNYIKLRLSLFEHMKKHNISLNQFTSQLQERNSRAHLGK
jgi:hypothetical protein